MFNELINVFLLTVLVFISLAQPSLLPYKPSGSPKMYYVSQLRQIPPFLDSTSDTTVESSHSGIMQKLFKILFFVNFFADWLVNSEMTYESSVLFNLSGKCGAFHASSSGLGTWVIPSYVLYTFEHLINIWWVVCLG